ncbi:MAG: radical SAM protein [Desulfuromonadaceae bacterium]|nr:radical SAM protein [Desulfuromonadaceae bacterium]
MTVAGHTIIRKTESVCPTCLVQLPAVIYETGDAEVRMHKECPEHGVFDVYIWPDAQRYKWYSGMAVPAVARTPQTASTKGCPHDCGLCPGHERSITLPEVEVTWRCNLACPVCFMFDGDIPADPTMNELRHMFESILRFDGQNLPIQITGGEPTIREDLPQIFEMARQIGFEAVELNTNGLVIGTDIEYLRSLKKAGLTNVYLQFDGLAPKTTIQLRGRDLLGIKMQAIDNCAQVGIPVILSVAIVKGVNDHELGDLIKFCMANPDAIKGLALQPAFVSGRFTVQNVKHLSIADVAGLIAEQSDGKITVDDFWPVGSSHPLCYGSTVLIGTADNFEPFTRQLGEDEYRRLIDRSSPQGAAFQDIIARLAENPDTVCTLPILIMEYMDAWTMDLERARGCNLAVTVTDGTSIPFCVYHLTDGSGKRVYPHGGRNRHGRCA